MPQKRKIKLKDINMVISVYTGKLRYKETGEFKMCDICEKIPAMWLHDIKNQPSKQVYLCFGCGNH